MNEAVFLEKNKTYNSENNINLILSPEFYWVRVFDIPIESKKEALLALPNLFEDFLDDIDGYKFYIIKLDSNKYLGFAYNDEQIKNAIKEAGLNLRKISSIYFAQNEFSSLVNKEDNTTSIFSIDESQYIYQDDILVKIPQSFYVDDSLSVELTNIELSKEYISLDNFSKFITNKQAYILSAIFICFALMFFSKTIYLENTIKGYDEHIDVIKSEANLPATFFQTKSILETLEGTQLQYTKLRDVLSYGINFKSQFAGILKDISFSNKRVVFTYSEVDEKKLKRYFSKLKNKKEFSGSTATYKVEVNL